MSSYKIGFGFVSWVHLTFEQSMSMRKASFTSEILKTKESVRFQTDEQFSSI